ncbi:MAG: hypothetical protein KIS67_02470 [Verrucomicrobiae bacterium]|nr:hypothetical protein [Verrucomicrobiae bacterium]
MRDLVAFARVIHEHGERARVHGELALLHQTKMQPKIQVAERKASAHILRMVAHVTKDGLVIPRRLLRGIKRVELRRGKNRITLFPADQVDPIAGLGRKPVTCGVPDGSTQHDRHLYNGKA